jgi:choline dehydrogenase-like flavoprotein
VNATPDYIIVGSGAAGATLAARLSEDQRTSVLLIESGNDDTHPLYRIPLGIGRLRESRRGLWRYLSEPETGLNGRQLPLATGNVLGGSAAINGMIFLRPPDADFDAWEAAGATGWGARAMDAAFARCDERSGGAIPARRARADHPLDRAYLAACRAHGIAAAERLDQRCEAGVAALDFTIRDGARISTPQIHLGALRARTNARIATHHRVLRVLFEGTRAIGVEVMHRGVRRELRAGREVVLAAGALASPQLLMLSGIGPAAQLRSLGIDVLADRRDVGAQLQNHVDIALRYGCTQPVTLHDLRRAERVIPAMLRAWWFGIGPAARFPGEVAAYLKTRADDALPDLLCHLVHGLAIGGIRWPLLRRSAHRLDQEGFSCRIMLMRPRSRGAVTLASADPFAAPRIAFRHLDDPDDLRRLATGVEAMRKIFADGAFTSWRSEELEPPVTVASHEIEAWIRSTADMQCHPAGTCAIGRVVDPELRVIGVAGLRVVDASVMPSIVGANTFATVVAIAERAAMVMRDAVRASRIST